MRLGNGRFESTTFNTRLQPTQIALGTSANNTSLLKLNYDYGTTDNNGNVKSQTITVAGMSHPLIQTYNYDSLNRLQSAEEKSNNISQWKQTFTFDRYGNRRFDMANTTMPDSQSNQNITNPQIDPSNNRFSANQGYEYDSSGNVTKDAANKRFIYDAENKQTSFGTNGSNTNGGTYFYDGDGKRIKKIVGTETTIFVYNASGQLVAEYTATAPTNPTISYLTSDTLGTPRINTDANGTVTARHDYMPFGEEIFNFGGRNSQAGIDAKYQQNDNIRQKFTQYERDDETDLDFAQARYYDYGHGRFTSVDPIMMTKKRLADPQSINLYIYTRNNPLRFIDPDGEEFKGTDGKRVEIEERDGQLVITSKNASKDLIRLVSLINGSGSSKALSQFNRLNAHKTMVNFVFADKDPEGTRGGLHQPHGTRPDGSKGALNFVNGKFEGEVDIVKDTNGNEVYVEATITIYGGMYRSTAEGDSVEDQLVATFGHEAEHDLDPKQVQETKNKTYKDSVYHARTPDGKDWAVGSPYWFSREILKEIREFRRKPNCPRSHMCF